MTLANLHVQLTRAAPNRSHSKHSTKIRARKVRGIQAHVLKLPSGGLIWTSTRLVDAWPHRQRGEFLHPLLSECAGSA